MRNDRFSICWQRGKKRSTLGIYLVYTVYFVECMFMNIKGVGLCWFEYECRDKKYKTELQAEEWWRLVPN